MILRLTDLSNAELQRRIEILARRAAESGGFLKDAILAEKARLEAIKAARA